MVLLHLETPAIPLLSPTQEGNVGALLVQESVSPEARRVMQSKRRVQEAMRRVMELDGGFLTYMDENLERNVTGICAEEVVNVLVERVAEEIGRIEDDGLVDVLRGQRDMISMGRVQLELDGANVIMRCGQRGAEFDGAIVIGNEPRRLALYDVTTSVQHLGTKLSEGDAFFGDMRQYFLHRYGIRLEKWHILLDEKLSGTVDPLASPLSLPRLPLSSSPEASVHVVALPLKRHMRVLRARTMETLRERHCVSRQHGRLRFS